MIKVTPRYIFPRYQTQRTIFLLPWQRTTTPTTKTTEYNKVSTSVENSTFGLMQLVIILCGSIVAIVLAGLSIIWIRRIYVSYRDLNSDSRRQGSGNPPPGGVLNLHSNRSSVSSSAEDKPPCYEELFEDFTSTSAISPPSYTEAVEVKRVSHKNPSVEELPSTSHAIYFVRVINNTGHRNLAYVPEENASDI